jgi:hypothetical protein
VTDSRRTRRSLKLASRLRAPSQPRGIARLSRRAFHAHASWVAAAPKSASMDPSTRFPPPLARRALDQPDGRCQHRRQESGNNGESRRVATRAPRRSARDPSRVASIATGRGVSGTAPRGVASRDRRRPARRPRSTGESNSTRGPTQNTARRRCARARSVPDWDACSKKDRRVFFFLASGERARIASRPLRLTRGESPHLSPTNRPFRVTCAQ